MDLKREKEKMERNAIFTFLTGTAIVYLGAIIYAYAKWNTDVVIALFGALGIIAVFMAVLFRRKKNKH